MNFKCFLKKFYDRNLFQKYIIILHDDCLCLAYRIQDIFIFKMSKVMLSHDLPKARVTQRISSGARTGSQVSQSQAKIKPSCCCGNFDYLVCVRSAGLYRSQKKPTLAELTKKEVNGRMEAKAKIFTQTQ